MKKQTAAPAMALDQERIAPCNHPKRFAFATVSKNAGSGAAIDCKIINTKETVAAYAPYDATKSFTSVKSPE